MLDDTWGLGYIDVCKCNKLSTIYVKDRQYIDLYVLTVVFTISLVYYCIHHLQYTRMSKIR